MKLQDFRITIFILTGVLFLSIFSVYAQTAEKEYYHKGVECGAQGKFGEAKECFQNVLKINPFFAQAKLATEIIEEVFNRKVNKDTAIYIFKGIGCANKEKFDEAINEFNRAIAAEPNYYRSYINRGAAYASKGIYDKALSDYNKVLEISPNNARAYNLSGHVYYQENNFD